MLGLIMDKPFRLLRGLRGKDCRPMVTIGQPGTLQGRRGYTASTFSDDGRGYLHVKKKEVRHVNGEQSGDGFL